ncbi:MAG: pilus assembly protein PilP [Gammaproteobacteria bacterium]|nr:MAG: pilus assembly protein PilP [Gammaproteobacteria bacterium]
MIGVRAAIGMLLATLAVGLSGCGRDMSDLEAYIAEVNARPGGRIEPLPVIRPYEAFAYNAFDVRSPFVPDAPVQDARSGGRDGLRPDSSRNREYLEQFPLDTLEMVGTLTQEGAYYGLVQTGDTLVHRVTVGNYLGQNDGRIIAIDETEIRVVEIIPDGIGGYIERSATIGLGEN